MPHVLQYKRSKTGGVEGVGMKLHVCMPPGRSTTNGSVHVANQKFEDKTFSMCTF